MPRIDGIAFFSSLLSLERRSVERTPTSYGSYLTELIAREEGGADSAEVATRRVEKRPSSLAQSSDLAQIPKLFVLYIAVLATPFFFILVWADGGPPFSLFTNLLIYLLSIPTVGFLDYLAITHFWRPQAQQQEGSLVMATWTIQGLLSMLAGTRLVASRLQEVEASSKIRIPVIVFLCLIAILVKLAGIVVISLNWKR
ncbi:hypothetical protein BDY24DRAFT_443700 [Mrakia frigida]|uniref:uncharacterized protein n=1 Tax=Mrakia frigida TaxID=29902 RepID=UPI003FCC1739